MAATPDESLGADQREAVEFLLRLGHALNQNGYPAESLKALLGAASLRLGLPHVEVYTTATGLQMAFGALSRQRTYLMAVTPGSLNLSRMAGLDQVALLVMDGTLTPAQGIERIERITAAASPYGPIPTALAYALASGAFAQLFGGGLREITLALVIGGLTGLLALAAARSDRAEDLLGPVAAFLAAFAAAAVAARFLPLSSSIVTLAALIVLLPGLTLTIALEELSTRHLVTGVGRLSAALIAFLGIVFGVAMGSQLAQVSLGQARLLPPTALPAWASLAAVAVSIPAITVILRAPPRDIGWVALGVAIAYGASSLGALALGPLGAFLGALALGVASNLFSILRNRPALLMQAPGLFILVPGSVGYLGLAALLQSNTLSGVQAAFQMFLIGAALVYGLLFANLISPDRTLGRIIGRAAHRALNPEPLEP
ncbi:MAG TPA: threonine/serine exporter family protein, partial [Ktedonobacterales bacterium]